MPDRPEEPVETPPTPQIPPEARAALEAQVARFNDPAVRAATIRGFRATGEEMGLAAQAAARRAAERSDPTP